MAVEPRGETLIHWGSFVVSSLDAVVKIDGVCKFCSVFHQDLVASARRLGLGHIYKRLDLL